MDKVKWAQLIKYLDTTDAKPEKVLNLVKQSFKPKGKKITKDDDFNQVRRAWTMYVVVGIYNKFGTPKKLSKEEIKKGVKKNITNIISWFVESRAYKMNYNLMHPVKTYNEKLKKYEWNTAEENLYKKKTVSQHSKNCRKLWDSPKGKEFRKHFERTKGKIPIFYKGQLNKIFDL